MKLAEKPGNYACISRYQHNRLRQRSTMESSHSFADVHYVSISLKRELLLYKQHLELRSETTSTHFACNTLAIVSTRTRRIPPVAHFMASLTRRGDVISALTIAANRDNHSIEAGTQLPFETPSHR